MHSQNKITIRQFLNSPLWHLFAIEKIKYIRLIVVIFITSIIAACLEGVSFAFILLAFATLGGESLSTLSQHAFLSSLSSQETLMSLSTNELFTIFILLAVCTQILRSFFGYLSQFYTTFLSTRCQLKIQEELYKKIFSFSFSCISKYKTGALLQYINIPSTIMYATLDALNKCLVAVLTLSVLGMMMWMISSSLTLAIFALFLITALLQKALVKKIVTASHHLSENTIDFSKHTTQTLHGIRAIYTFNRQFEIQKGINIIIGKIANFTKKLNLWNSAVQPINEVIGVILVGLSLMIGPFFLKDTTQAILPVLLTYVTLAYRLATRVQIVSSSAGTIAYYLGPIFRLEEIFSDSDKEFTPTGGKPFVQLKNEIIFDQITLRYPSKEQFAVNNLSIAIPKGKVTAFVGASGAGKSSVIDLLLRLYEPTRGGIFVDGQNLNQFNIGSWRDQLGVVSQENIIFNETIEENVRFGNHSASMEEIIYACEIAGAHPFILKLPGGYQTVLGERGYRLSGGEKQRLALARALLKQPQILILDEATSNLDSHSEFYIQEALDRLQGNVTMIIIAHRLSTIAKADRIFVLDHGSLLEEGSHEELLAKQGKYAKLWNVQFDVTSLGVS